MKSIYYIALVCLLLLSCEEDATIKPKPYPTVRTNQVKEVNSNGAIFSAQLSNVGIQEIVDFGFILEGGGQVYNFSLACHSKKGTKVTNNCPPQREGFPCIDTFHSRQTLAK